MAGEPKVIRSIERARPEEIEALGRLGVATVHEENHRKGLMHGPGSLTPGARAWGSAVTCLNFAGDNLMMHAAIDVCEPGDVLVVALTAPSQHAMLGELVATCCRTRGIAGVVIDASARDLAELRAMGFPVWARGVSASGTTKTGLGWVNVPVSCGGVVVFPGDVVVADDDGVVVVERAAVPEVLAGGLARLEREDVVRRRLAAGETTLDTGGLRARLAAIDPGAAGQGGGAVTGGEPL